MWTFVIKYRTICLIIGFLGLVSAVLGFAAEFTRIKVSQVHQVSPGVCSYPRSPAYVLGTTSAITLLVAHVIINLFVKCIGGCICCRRNPHTSTTHWTLALVCCIVSWFTFVVAFLVLSGGAILNDQHGAENVVYLGYKHCYILKPGVFAAASVLSLASVTFSILYFLITVYAEVVGSSSGDPGLPNEGGVAMVQAQVPPTSHDPLFVHEGDKLPELLTPKSFDYRNSF